MIKVEEIACSNCNKRPTCIHRITVFNSFKEFHFKKHTAEPDAAGDIFTLPGEFDDIRDDLERLLAGACKWYRTIFPEYQEEEEAD